VTPKEIAEKLREALRLMNDSGKHWIKGDWQQELDEVDEYGYYQLGYCSVGAIRVANNVDDIEADDADSNACVFALAELLPAFDYQKVVPAYRPDPSTPEGRTTILTDRVIRWNDKEERTWEEIVEKFSEAANRQEAMGE